MNLSKKIPLLILIAGFALVGCSFLANNETDTEQAENETLSTGLPGRYEEYSPELFSELQGNEKFLLFFHADWCPLCRALEAKIKNDIGVLNGRTVLEADYDIELDLRKEYSVLAQVTVIFFNADGTIANKKVNPRLSAIEEFFK